MNKLSKSLSAPTLLPVILFAISLLLLFAWLEARPVAGLQWNFHASLSTPTPTLALSGPGWWNGVKTPAPKP